MARTGLALVALAIAACSGENESTAETPAGNGTPGADETAAATHTAVVPSVTREATSTPSPEVPSPENVSIEVAFPNLPEVERPVALVEVPGEDAFLLASQEGFVYVFAKGAATSLPTALDWEARTRRDHNEEGLLGIALSPDFATDRQLYLSYTAADGDRRSVLSRFTVSGAGAEMRIEPASEQVVLEVPQPFGNHNGGHILFGPDEFLYVGLGDGGSAGDPQGNGQNLATLLGSMLRIDVTGEATYSVPVDNPFADSTGSERIEIWAYGLRNPWRFSFDRETGTLWTGDVGQDVWEEIDVIEPGANYGWNVMEGFECYGGGTCDQTGLALPRAVYSHGEGCSVTGGYVARGAVNGVLNGYYVYGDFCSGRMWALDAADDDAEPVVIAESGLNIASFAEGEDGAIYILAFDGRIYRLLG